MFKQNIKNISILVIYLLSTMAHAEFDIRETCEDDTEITDGKGRKHKFYAGMLAYNSEQPRCLKNNPVLTLQHINEAIIHNYPETNDIIVEILLTDEGSVVFSDYSGKNSSTEIALVVEDKILSMMTLLGPITNGKIRIQGLWYEDAVRLSNSINLK